MLIQLGSRGDEVSKLQEKLRIDPNGVFDLLTKIKVCEWQDDHHFDVTGIVDQAMWDELFPAAIVLDKSFEFFDLNVLARKIPKPVLEQIPDVVMKFSITTPLRLSHFLSQCSHESAGFKIVFENLNYSSEGLMRIFPKYFTPGLAAQYARQPILIGSRVYANRMGNGDEASGEGYKYRGRGFIQLTGKNNYKLFSAFVNEDVVQQPDLVAIKYPLTSAAFYFENRNIWPVCDRGASDQVVKDVTKMVNGGTIGLEERKKLFYEYYLLLK